MSAPNLVTYLRMLLNRGATDDGRRILTDEQFATMIAPHTGETPVPTYGYGLSHETENEPIERIGHGGGMVGWLSDMSGDLASGLGVVVLHNGAGSPHHLAAFALKALVAAQRGDPLPDVPAPISETAIANAADYLGTYDGTGSVEVVAYGDGIALVRDGETLPLLHPREGDAFVIDRPGDDRFAVVFQRNEEKAVTGLTHGELWYANDRDTGPRDAETPAAWAAYIGHYRSYNPWFSNLRIVARRGGLHVVFGGHYETPLTPTDDPAAFILTAPRTPAQTIRFDPIVSGRALALTFADGTTLTRVFTD
jgi:hypothetical protein